jgi:hypothetical protein
MKFAPLDTFSRLRTVSLVTRSVGATPRFTKIAELLLGVARVERHPVASRQPTARPTGQGRRPSA